MEQRTLPSISSIEERLKNIDELIHIYEYNWYMVGVAYEQDRYDLGALERLKNEKNYLLDLLRMLRREGNETSRG